MPLVGGTTECLASYINGGNIVILSCLGGGAYHIAAWNICLEQEEVPRWSMEAYMWGGGGISCLSMEEDIYGGGGGE